MQENKITRMVEEVIRTEYIAEDGEVFWNKEECEKYEQSALFALSNELKRLVGNKMNELDFFLKGYEDHDVEVFDIQTERELEVLKRYLYLAMNARDTEYGRKGYKTHTAELTRGHEIIIVWDYEHELFYTYRDGSIQGYLDEVKQNMERIIFDFKQSQK